MAKRYVRTIPSKKVRDAIKEAKKVKKVLFRKPPEEVTCKVCYKKIPYKNALWQDGKGCGHRGFWMCMEHNSSYQMSPLKFTMQKLIGEINA